MEERIEVFPNELPGLITVIISFKTKLNKSKWSMMRQDRPCLHR